MFAGNICYGYPYLDSEEISLCITFLLESMLLENNIQILLFELL